MFKKIKIIIVALLFFSSLGIGIAKANYSVNVGGGYWKYWQDSKYAFSEYYHGDRVHSAAVKVGSSVNSSGWVSPGYWAKASAPNSWWYTEQFYYNYK